MKETRDEWILLTVADSNVMAMGMQEKLSEHDIECFLLDQTDSVYPMLSEIKLMIHPDNLEKAKEILNLE